MKGLSRDEGCVVGLLPNSPSGNGGRALPALCCKREGRFVSHRGINGKNRVAPEKLSQATYKLCRNLDCPIVYFAPGIIIEKTELRVRVNFKEKSYDGPVCYCFNHTVASIKAEIQSKGYSTAPERIAREVKAGRRLLGQKSRGSMLPRRSDTHSTCGHGSARCSIRFATCAMK